MPNGATIANIETADFVLPAYWASYLINGDDSGQTVGETAEIDRWVNQCEVDAIVTEGVTVSAKHLAGCLNVSDDTRFSWWNDANNGLGGDVETFTFLLTEQEPA